MANRGPFSLMKRILPAKGPQIFVFHKHSFPIQFSSSTQSTSFSSLYSCQLSLSKSKLKSLPLDQNYPQKLLSSILLYKPQERSYRVFAIRANKNEIATTPLVEDSLGKSSDNTSTSFGVLNFYKFCKITSPEEEVECHRNFLKERDIRSRIYINEQGINAQLSGPLSDLEDYGNWVKADERFGDVFLQFSPSPSGHVFPRFKVRYKPSLVQVEGGTQGLPLEDRRNGAVPLPPKLWREKLDKAGFSDSSGGEEEENGRQVLLLDVRNGYEWDVGHFLGAKRPEVDNFRETKFGVSNSNKNDPLSGVDKEKTDILMYCTGGIRCDVYSNILRKEGFKNLYTLEGGVARYLKEEGSGHWAGKLFVFDSRLAVDPHQYRALDSESQENPPLETSSETTLATCIFCTANNPSVAHRNCANLDCNELFLVCQECAGTFKGCCCEECQNSSRLRPFFPDPKPYGRWHNYRPESQLKKSPGAISGRAARRQIRRKLRKAAEEGSQIENLTA